LNSPEYGEEDRMTTVPAEPAAPAAEEERHRLTVLEEADRGRAARLATVSHDLRAPLAAAKAAVSGLRAGDAQLTTDDRADLLAAAEESLNQLAHLAEAMGGTVEPEDTPGGGLTMVLTLPAAPARPAADPRGARRMRAA
jgi:signal transduction histidine kinase